MIEVLRLSHRPFRDKRITTHCCLAARAFGADSIIYSGNKDVKLEDSIAKNVENFGGSFSIRYEKDAISFIKEKKEKNYLIVHLTVYGLPYQDNIEKLKGKNILIIIGSEKVQPEIYHLADYNLAVTSQPHSEVSALAIFLHDLFQGKELEKDFKNAKLKILPSKHGKNIANYK